MIKMGCTPAGHKNFLFCCNVVLLFVGLTVLSLGLKMKFALTVMMLINIPMIMKAVEAVIATGFFIAFSGVTGIWGVCSESLFLLMVHLTGLGVILIMEFSLGVTLMIIKNSIENAINSVNCNNICAAALDAIVLHYALPSSGLMMTVIIVEALMIYCSIRLYFYIRDRPKGREFFEENTLDIIQNVQMRSVASPQTMNQPPIHSIYSPHLEYMPYQVHRFPIQQYNAAQEAKPPEYTSLLPQQQQQPPQQRPVQQLSQQMLPQPPPYTENVAAGGGATDVTVKEIQNDIFLRELF